MNSFYSVIKYTPNPLSEESINFGLIAFDGSDVELRITEDWHRAATFGRKAPEALKEAVGLLTTLDEQNALTERAIRKMVETWQREVTLTLPRASTLTVEALAERLTKQMLRFPAETAQAAGKRQVIGEAKTSMLGALVHRYKVSKTRARGALKSTAEIEGHLKGHTLDLSVFNGKFLGGAIGLSLVQQSRQQAERDLDGAAFVISDLRAQTELKKRPLYVLAQTRGIDRDTVEKASELFRKVGGEFVREQQIPDWSKQFVDRLPTAIFADHAAS